MFTVERAEIWVGNNSNKSQSNKTVEKPVANFVKNVLTQIQSPLLGAEPIVHPWLNLYSPQNFYRARRVFNVPAHLSIKKVSEILLYLN